MDFNHELPEGKTVDQVATETAEKWCKNNQDGWEYTGTWKSEKEGEETISFFQVRKSAVKTLEKS